MPVVLDLFPADVALPDQTLRGVRVVATHNRLYVAGRNGQGHELIHETSVETFTPRRGRVWDLTSSDGIEMQVRRGSGCGCGNPLRRIGVSQIVPT